jgi:hypothetical protein
MVTEYAVIAVASSPHKEMFGTFGEPAIEPGAEVLRTCRRVGQARSAGAMGCCAWTCPDPTPTASVSVIMAAGASLLPCVRDASLFLPVNMCARAAERRGGVKTHLRRTDMDVLTTPLCCAIVCALDGDRREPGRRTSSSVSSLCFVGRRRSKGED